MLIEGIQRIVEVMQVVQIDWWAYLVCLVVDSLILFLVKKYV
jgi:hypothetical protein